MTNHVPFIGHQQILSFAIAQVNLSPYEVMEYRRISACIEGSLASETHCDPAYTLVQSMQYGSFAKGTAIRTTQDLDLAVYVRPGTTSTTVTHPMFWLLKCVRRALAELDDEHFVPQHYALAVYKNDVKIDIVPIIVADENHGDGFVLHRVLDIRIFTNIPRHLEFTHVRSVRAATHFLQLVRLVKWWVHERAAIIRGFRFSSFLVELLCAKMVDKGLNLSDYSQALRDFFAYIVTSELREVILFTDYYDSDAVPAWVQRVMTVLDPVNPANNVVYDYTDWHRRTIVAAAQDALEALDRAEDTRQRSEAVEAWRRILGGTFEM